MRRLALLVCVLALSAATGSCNGESASRAPDVRYDPTPHNVVAEMLALAQVNAKDIVYDLGCGDGRIVVAAAQQFGARGVCVDIDPQRIREGVANARRAGVAERIVFMERDLFAIDLGEATVVTLFLSPPMNLKLQAKLWRELKPGTRVVSYVHGMGDWMPQETRRVQSTAHGSRTLYLWIIPAAPRP